MPADTAQGLLAWLINVGMGAVLLAALTAAVFSALRLPARTARRTLERFFRELRRRQFYDVGVLPRRTTLKAELRRMSDALFSEYVRAPTDTRRSGLPAWFATQPWAFATAAPDDGRLKNVFPDADDESLAEAAAALRSLRVPVQRSLHVLTWSICFAAALVLAHGWRFDSLELLNATTVTGLTWNSPASLYAGPAIDWSMVAGVWISATVIAIVAAAMLQWVNRRAFDLQPVEPTPNDDDSGSAASDEDIAPLGKAEETLRTLCFSGGAFDTVMQVGVAHALLAIQGRAPDAVVGVSGGAVNAVAVAEILQAGEEHERACIRDALGLADDEQIDASNIAAYWQRLRPEHQRRIHRQRRAARVEMLRRCIEAAQQAPGTLFDALLPDPYQIESDRPLHPLAQPRFSPEERMRRTRAAVRRTGLVRLYNDILNIPFSLGILVRAVRRVLGILAAREIRGWRTRWAMRIVEALRLWVLVGVNLLYAAPLLRVILRSFRRPRRVTAATAGNLIFRFRPISFAAVGLKNVTAFVFLLMLWVGVTMLPFSFGHLLAPHFEWVRQNQIWFTTFIYLLVIVPTLVTGGGLTQAERSTLPEIVKGATSTGVILYLLAYAWSLAWLAIVGGCWWLLNTLSNAQMKPLFVTDGLPFWPLTYINWVDYSMAMLAVLVVPALLVAALVFNAVRHERDFADRLLASYHLDDAVLRVHGLRGFLSRLFDRDFYPKPPMDEVVEESLRDQIRHDMSPLIRNSRQVGHYNSSARLEPMHVGVAVANTSSGNLDVIRRERPVIEALVAALSTTPLFRPTELDGQLYINGSDVANEPTRALLRYLRDRINAKPGPIHIYSVSPFPVSQATLGKVPNDDGAKAEDAWPEAPAAMLNLIDVTTRAIRLQRLRDATMERRLTELVSRALRPGENRLNIPKPRINDKDKDWAEDDEYRFLRAWITPIELDSATNTNARLIGASKQDRRRKVLQAIADGCRASLQVMMGDAIRDTVEEGKRGVSVRFDGGVREWIAPCGKVVKRHLASSGDAELATMALPGSRAELGPGLAEVCRHCRIWRESVPATDGEGVTRPELARHNAGHLRQRDWWEQRGPAWPFERSYEPDQPPGDPHFVAHANPAKAATEEALRAIRTEVRNDAGSPCAPQPQAGTPAWPLRRSAAVIDADGVRRVRQSGDDRTMISLLFSGGVFRGVYQMGVLTALDQLNLKPDVIAGASVGSITAAMIAETFSIANRRHRHARIAQLAAVYIAIDRIILTDRFADFVRDLTLRAADTRFSIRQADRLFRKYDYPRMTEFDRNARDVIAGLERLLYVNPWQLHGLIRDLRNQNYGRVLERLKYLGQQYLDRMFVGEEVLGADALEELIDAYVTRDRSSLSPLGLQFDDLRRQSGIQLLATATNLSQGQLEILGERPGDSAAGMPSPILSEGLLASSAFPGVFRPRWSWELYPETEHAEQYIDGGVMDNLPIDAVAAFLYRACRAGLIRARPEAGPHLVVAASLQVNARKYALPTTRAALQKSWLKVRRRAKELRYNTKIDIYQQTQEMLRLITEHYAAQTTDAKTSDDLRVMDFEVVTVKPNWLCNTFAFHPMLGFRRDSQKRSIAHGCASTLLRFGKIGADEATEQHLSAWRVRLKAVPKETTWAQAFKRLDDRERLEREGLCWLTERPCPFARASLRRFSDAEQGLEATTIDEVADIHRLCMQPASHLRRV